MTQHASDITLRPVTDADRPFLLSVYASTREEELAPVPWTPEQKFAFVEMQFDAQTRWWDENYQGAERSVIVVDGEPAGRLYLLRMEGDTRIVDIAIIPRFRGRGVGSKLLGDLLAEAGAAGRTVSIHVEKMNPALHLYERLGFRVEADRGLYFFMRWSARPQVS